MRVVPRNHRARNPSGIFRRLAWVCVLVAFAAISAASPAAAKYASLVLDVETGRILHAVNADTKNYPASLTKIMTLYLVFYALDKGKIKLDTRFDVSDRATRQAPSKLGLEAGSTISVEDAILALVTKSANDVATVIAENLGGTERKFARTMTSVARKLGMSQTTFRNASGLPNSGQTSSARDMALLARAMLRTFPHHYHYFSTTEFRYRGATYGNHNHLLKNYDGADGIKTGYINASGFNLVASAVRDGKRVIGVVFGGRTAKTRDRHMTQLLDKGFAAIDTREAVVAANEARREEASKIPAQWAIQVGAFGAREPAMESAQKAIELAPDILEEGAIKITPLTKRNGKTLFRARVMGLDRDDALAACSVLKRHKVPCMALRLRDTELAAADGS